MGFGQALFVRDCPGECGDLEKTMLQAKKKFSELQIIFVVIDRKGDPAYSKSNSHICLQGASVW